MSQNLATLTSTHEQPSAMKVELSQVAKKDLPHSLGQAAHRANDIPLQRVQGPQRAHDERVEFVVQSVKKAVEVFITAIRNSSEDQTEITFKAFTLNIEDKKEISQVFDFITAVVPIEIAEQAEDLVKLYTFYHNVEDASFFFHCRKIAPPTSEEIEAALKAEEEAKKAKEKEEVTLPHASAMSAYKRPGDGE